MDRPLLICLTPIRNEAWVLHAFLKATSLWADYIIIADQMSTDGSKEIAISYPKVILIDNTLTEMHQAQSRNLLFEEAKKIKGKKILFALDADEFLSGDFTKTQSWNKILNSKTGDLFLFKWINLCENPEECIITKSWMHWASTVDDTELDSYFPDTYIHELRLPYPNIKANEILIDDIYFILEFNL
ncbi:MAG: glycosyltransferase family 2 protein [Bacteroidia bacterium]